MPQPSDAINARTAEDAEERARDLVAEQEFLGREEGCAPAPQWGVVGGQSGV